MGSQPAASILVIDDEIHLLEIIRESLMPPHQVTDVSTSAAALALLLGPEGQGFDLVLCDIGMPGQSGLVIHREAGRVSAALAERFVFITGGAMTPEAEDLLRSGMIPVLRKPFTPSALKSFVEQALASQA